MYIIKTLLMLFAFIFIVSCYETKNYKFTLLPPSKTNVYFENNIKDDIDFSILNYLYFYDGGGVAVGDVNNNGLPDIFFVGNDVDNRLYINKGEFVFEDITESAGIAGDPGAWSKGATMADVNGNGFLDIYVSRVNYLNRSGANQLFINNGDGTFAERAEEFGLDFEGYSTQAVFFDYNKSGRLDMFLLNHSFHSEKPLGQVQQLREIDDPKAGDRLFRNDGDRFTEVTYEAGIYTSALGYGLGIAVSDITNNGWPDIYVGNDFLEDDYLYINQGDGTFIEALYSSFGHTSGSSMGNDIADITNTGYVDIISLDMMPEDHETYMRSAGPDIQSVYDSKMDLGYGHKNARNTLQINRGKNPEGSPVFSETAFLSGIAKTDWSWASLFMDLNNNGWKDLLVTNGMIGRPNDMDYISWSRRTDPWAVSDHFNQSLDLMPELKIPNYVFLNNGDLSFSDMTELWGFNQPTFSSGAAYADLNNNGRLDLIVNNLNMPSYIYKNNTPVDDEKANFLKVQLFGDNSNTTGIGSKIRLYKEDKIFFQEQMPTRGYQSSVDHVLHFGVGEIVELDSLVVIWPDNRYESITQVETNQQLNVFQKNSTHLYDYQTPNKSWENPFLIDVTNEIDLDFLHKENSFNDYAYEPLMPYRLSRQGPALAVGDVTGNGLDDVFIGGASGQTAKLFIQMDDGRFREMSHDIFEDSQISEDVDAMFFDATGNGALDLYVVSGGGQFTGNDPGLLDRLYINKGDGHFSKAQERLPDVYVNGSVVRPGDYNGNGHIDLFIGGRSVPFRYGDSPKSILLENNGSGYFVDVTDKVAPELRRAGMTTDAHWAFISNNQYPDLVITAEWMPIQYYRNDGGTLVKQADEAGLSSNAGLWQSLFIDDITGNGHVDIIAGNFGLNSRIQASIESPFRLYINDFDGNGLTTAVMAHPKEGEYYPFDQLDELVQQHNILTRRIDSYKDFSTRTMQSLFGEEMIASSTVLQITDLKTSFFKNNGDGTFARKELPIETQFSPVMAMYAIGKDVKPGKDLIFGGNLHDVRPSVGGRQDANYGLYLKWNDGDDYQSLEMQNSGLYVRGEVRGIMPVKVPEGKMLIVTRNNNKPVFYRLN